jgi:hypothetical protein
MSNLDLDFLLLMLLGTVITRIFTLKRDTPEERRDPVYQFFMFCLHFLVYIPAYGIITWLMH